MSDHHAPFSATINGSAVVLHARPATARHLLAAAGFEPADDHVLVQITRPGSRAVGLDDELPAGGHAEYHAFRSDRVHTFTVDGRGYAWGAPKISSDVVRDLAGIGHERILFLEHKGNLGLEIDDGTEISLAHAGTEHIRSEPGQVAICFNGPERRIPRNSYTTEQLIELLGVERGYLLNVMGHDKQLRTLRPGEIIVVCKGHRFISQAPCGASS